MKRSLNAHRQRFCLCRASVLQAPSPAGKRQARRLQDRRPTGHFRRLLTRAFALIILPAIFAQAPAEKKTPNWDDTFEGVVHDAKKIGGFVGDYRWLSNFFECRVEWEGRVYGSAEAAYQSGKFPPAERDAFVKLDPDGAKKLAHAKLLADPAAWEARKEQVMRDVAWAKFSQHPELAAKLRATGDRLLEETNWWGDEIWGVYNGKGTNLLGKVLMETRARLAANDEKKK